MNGRDQGRGAVGAEVERSISARIEASQAPRGWSVGRGIPSPLEKKSGERAISLSINFFRFWISKWRL